MRILILGLMFCEKSLKEAYRISRAGVSMAPHKFQSSLLQGMHEIAGEDITVFNIPPMGSFPLNNKKLFLPEYRWGRNNIQLGYLNLPVLKHIQQKKRLERLIKKCIAVEPDTKILIYSLYEPFVSIAAKIKEKYPQVKVYLIQPDAVPGRNDMEKYMTDAARKRGDKLVALSKTFDGFVLFSEYLKEPLEVGDRAYTIVECICNQNQRKSAVTDGKKKICLYMGELDKSFGLCELAQAVAKIDQGELWICGRGDAEKEILSLTQKCSRIKYFGYVDAERGAKLRNQCDYLINPRRPSGTYTLYSFPSKTVEYMMAAKPVIMYKLEAIPDEYDEYLNYLTAENVDDLAGELKTIFDNDYNALCEKANLGREFILSEKSAVKQGKKIIELMEQ